jgi:hypothetical protein
MPEETHHHETRRRRRGEPITLMGRSWEGNHSLWIAWTFTFVLSFVAFFYIGSTSRNGRYMRWGALMLLAVVLPVLVTLERGVFLDAGQRHAFGYVVMVAWGLLLAAGIAAIIHAFRIRPEYLSIMARREQGEVHEARPLRRGPDRAAWRSRPVARWGMAPHWERNATAPAPPEYGPVTGGARAPEPPEVHLTEVNNCPLDELNRLPGLPTVVAKRVDEIRKTRRGFHTVDECCQVLRNLGLNEHEIRVIRPMITVAPMVPRNKRLLPGRVVDY